MITSPARHSRFSGRPRVEARARGDGEQRRAGDLPGGDRGGAGASVQGGDIGPAAGQHQRVTPVGDGLVPAVEHRVRGRVPVGGGMDPAALLVGVQDPCVAGAQARASPRPPICG